MCRTPYGGAGPGGNGSLFRCIVLLGISCVFACFVPVLWWGMWCREEGERKPGFEKDGGCCCMLHLRTIPIPRDHCSVFCLVVIKSVCCSASALIWVLMWPTIARRFLLQALFFPDLSSVWYRKRVRICGALIYSFHVSSFFPSFLVCWQGLVLTYFFWCAATSFPSYLFVKTGTVVVSTVLEVSQVGVKFGFTRACNWIEYVVISTPIFFLSITYFPTMAKRGELHLRSAYV